MLQPKVIAPEKGLLFPENRHSQTVWHEILAHRPGILWLVQICVVNLLLVPSKFLEMFRKIEITALFQNQLDFFIE